MPSPDGVDVDLLNVERRIEVLAAAVESLLKAVESLAGAPPVIAQDPDKRTAQVWAKTARHDLRGLDT
jgi:hypothetical protein